MIKFLRKRIAHLIIKIDRSYFLKTLTRHTLDKNIIPIISRYSKGTILVFDDWLCYRGDPNKGEQRGAKEFLKRYPEIELIPFQRFGIVGNSFIVDINGED